MQHSIKTFVMILLSFTLLPIVARAEQDIATPKEAQQIAAEAYVYAYPLVLMDITRRLSINSDTGAPMNMFSHMREYPPGDFKEVIRPNFDTLYSSAWLDLTKEPVIVSTPNTQGRYYLLPMMDMWTDVFSVPGSRTSGTQEGHFAVTGPDWIGKLPMGVTQIPSPTPFVWIIGRTQTNGAKDYAAVHKVQDGYKLTPLSDWGMAPKAIKATFDPSVDMKTPPVRQVNDMPAKQFFSYAAELMKVHHPHMTDGSILMRMKRIGLEPGKSFDLGKMPSQLQNAIAEGAKQGLNAMRELAMSKKDTINGWATTKSGIGVFGNNYLLRATIAMIGLGGVPPEDAVYPINFTDANGQAVMGGKRYVMHFAKNGLPPADAFWSITMYNAEGFPIPNTIKRYAIGDRDELKFNPDGSLDIYIQPESPGKDKESNWLPSAKSGALGMTMRLYAPKPSILRGEWNPPVVKAVK